MKLQTATKLKEKKMMKVKMNKQYTEMTATNK